jgi:hypothetical protein
VLTGVESEEEVATEKMALAIVVGKKKVALAGVGEQEDEAALRSGRWTRRTSRTDRMARRTSHAG